MTIVTARL